MATDTDLNNLRTAKTEVIALIALLISGIQQSQPASLNRRGDPAAHSGVSDSQSTPQHNPLAVFQTAATLLSSQSTHLGLLSLTPPFTPTALTKTLQTIKKLLPAFVAALQDAEHPRVPECILKSSRTHVRSLFEAVRAFVSSVPGDAAAQRKLRAERGELRDAAPVLRGTGAVWEGCDWFSQAGENGVRWIASKGLEDSEGLVRDAAQELEEWTEDDGDGDDADQDHADSDEDDIFGGAKTCSPALRPLARNVLAHIGLLKELYPGLRKIVDGFPSLNKHTRLESLPDEEASMQLNAAVGLGADATRRVDDLAGELYGEQEDAIVRAVQRFNDDIGGRAEQLLGEVEWIQQWRELRPEG